MLKSNNNKMLAYYPQFTFLLPNCNIYSYQLQLKERKYWADLSSAYWCSPPRQCFSCGPLGNKAHVALRVFWTKKADGWHRRAVWNQFTCKFHGHSRCCVSSLREVLPSTRVLLEMLLKPLMGLIILNWSKNWKVLLQVTPSNNEE